MDEQLLTALWLANGLGYGSPHGAPLLELYGSPQAVWQATGSENYGQYLTPGQAEILSATHPMDFALMLEQCQRQGVQLISWEDERYPLAFTRIPDPPVLLFCTGDAAALNGHVYVGMVGSRRPTPYGVQACEEIGTGLAKAGAVIVSGLADGLDGEAHRAALAAHAPTVGIMGLPIDKTYPATNRALRTQMEQQGGAVITEILPGAEGMKNFFLLRNRLIAALSDALCVVEAREKSGTMNTVSHAKRYGTPVYAVPGSIFNKVSGGTNRLIQQGEAYLLTGAQDLLEPLGLAAAEVAETTQKRQKPSLTPQAAKLLAAIGGIPARLEALCETCGMETGAALAAITELELAGLVHTLPGRQYLRR